MTGSVKSSRNDISALSDPKFLFRGKHVLSVKEPEEPNTIRLVLLAYDIILHSLDISVFILIYTPVHT